MASINRVSERTLRVYHREGLLEPCYINEETGYRYYALSQCETLDLIQQLKELGFSLAQIKHLIDQNDVDLLEEQVGEQIARIEEELSHLVLVKRTGETLLKHCRTRKDHLTFGEIQYETLPDRKILRLGPMQKPEPCERAAEAFTIWEQTLRKCKNTLIDKAYPAILFKNICDTASQESVESGSFTYKDAIVFIDDALEDAYNEVEILPGGIYVTMYCDNYADEEGRFIEPQFAARMVQDLTSKGYRIAGDYIGETLSDTPIFCNSRQNMLARLQIRVERNGEVG